ncbi:hypothetical protein D9758_018813 [Tetrapyrgos nigripes]|uniref:F-box domain-containing protein n=1 Tax=Tetrapyrgos nigripes TaxID=182062 RepID=A0A8H5AUZ7_9AGAR|nr:hypothetical protein D9758_018813 [Tetrapyrgos nigripes]
MLAEDYLELFMGEFHRWKDVSLDMSVFNITPDTTNNQHESDSSGIFAPLSNTPLPMLEVLSIKGLTTNTHPKLPWIGECPKLHTLRLFRYDPSILPTSLQNTWSQLTHIELAFVKIDTILQTLSMCPNLICAHLSLDCRISHIQAILRHRVSRHPTLINADSNPNQIILTHCPTLRELHIRLWMGSRIGTLLTYEPLMDLFQNLQCPTLRTLSLTSGAESVTESSYLAQAHAQSQRSWSRKHVNGFLSRSGLASVSVDGTSTGAPANVTATLRRLVIKYLPLCTSDVLDFLRNIPGMTDLTIHDVRDVRDGEAVGMWRHADYYNQEQLDGLLTSNSSPSIGYGNPSAGPKNSILTEEFFEQMYVGVGLVRQAHAAPSPLPSPSHSADLLPNLSRLEIKLWNSNKKEDVDFTQELEKMVASRWQARVSSANANKRTGLECVVIRLMGTPYPFDHLRRFRNEGMLVKVVWDTEMGEWNGRGLLG